MVVRRRKVALHTSSHLTPTEAWRSDDSTTSEGRTVSSEVRLGNCTQVWGWAKFKERRTRGWGKIVLHTCSDLSRLVRTYGSMQWPCTLDSQCHFLYFRMLLFFGLTSCPAEICILTRLMESFPMVYGLWRCIEVKLSIPRGAHA